MDSVKKYLYTCDHVGFLELTKETWKNRWFPSQVPLQGDVCCVDMLNERDLEFYKFLFTFLGMAEKLVNINIEDLLSQFDSHDVSHYYAEQMAMENIHGKVYANILSMLFKNNITEVYSYACDIMNDSALQEKLKWLNGRVTEASDKAEKILLFLLVEGIFFISSFFSIGLFRVRGIMNGICLANDYIARDEMLHTSAAALLYNTMTKSSERPSEDWIYKLFREAVEVEFKFIAAKGHGVSLVNVHEIRQFLQATADRILESINLNPIYGSLPPENCPLAYTSSTKSVNFFERDNSDYTGTLTNDL
uniref:ribonucleoside-diphosphate reductase n=1 Tax=Saimiriine herpesvirus 2 (strain 488) TaxID=10384 RepID=Q80BM0_SHV2C|nr:RRsmall [Saimiriine gammaherpesvirus 2]